MAPEELRDSLREQPFAPFRLHVTGGVHYDIRHPDLLWVGRRTAYVGRTGDASQTLSERSVKVDLVHVTHIEPLDSAPAAGSNGQAH